ncbi:NAD(P)-dependent oxidoreductase [Desulforhopalus sp. IMCC35007]|uniref:NAD(P)-dependent oxidoreductase n=1 Tax=Desulforhopalus sp. IMCC35007 TaxID=2569543 RepID=UPI0010ADEC14|nr:NAD(P)-dependent oxidoreductase [Desulforhopalus sp. IMCC35007]TKB06913.1 NAD(P)-dependent oxidoreductase [Desulforhopalus sp. IMCC35007]
MADGVKPQIGFIGLGLMGSAMVQRLQDLGYDLTVVAHRNRAPIEKAVSRGAKEVKTPAEVAKNSEIIMLCVDTSAAVEAVMRGENGVLEGLQAGSVVIDFGTSIPAGTRALAAECEKKGATMLDAPLGRTPAQAVDGLLNIMTAGKTEDFERVKPVLEDLGENVFHVGPIGAGHTLKLINNFFGMTMACAMSEAFAMADLAGLDRGTLYNVMSAGPLKSGMMEFIKIGAVDKKPENMAFSIANAGKDVGYYSKMADDFGVPSLMSPSVKSTLGLAKASGYGEKMVPEMVDFIADIFKKD